MTGNASSGRVSPNALNRRQLRLCCNALKVSCHGTVPELKGRIRRAKGKTQLRSLNRDHLRLLARANNILCSRGLTRSQLVNRLCAKKIVSAIKLTMNEMFAGIGGAALGATRAGIRVMASVDSDPGACGTYAFNHGTSPFCVDVSSRWPDLPRADLLWASPPCQPFARIGKQLGFLDPRGLLMMRIPSYLRKFKPLAAVLEQSPNVQNVNDGRDWQTWLTAANRAGYSVQCFTLDAFDFQLPQHRVRLFIVLWRKALRLKVDTPVPGPRRSLSAVLRKPCVKDVSRAIRASGGGGAPEDSHDFTHHTLRDGGVYVANHSDMLKIQGFPAAFRFPRGLTAASKQRMIGNAVPPAMAAAVLTNVRVAIANAEK